MCLFEGRQIDCVGHEFQGGAIEMGSDKEKNLPKFLLCKSQKAKVGQNESGKPPRSVRPWSRDRAALN